MKACFIGGTGTISMAIVRLLSADPNWEVYTVNRGNRGAELPENVHQIIVNDLHDEDEMREKLAGLTFDTVAEFFAFGVPDVERDYRLFKGRTNQYIFISSASAYHKPCADYRISESTTLANPYWEYSRNKIACEDFLMGKYRAEGFPVTIVRPSHTYDERSVPLGVHGKKGSWQVVKRMLEGKPVIIQGDGTSLWTLTFNTDFAIGFKGLMGNKHAIGEAFQITGDESLTWNMIYQTIADALGVPLKAYHISSEFLAAVGDPMGYDYTGSLIGDKAVTVVFDNTKIRRVSPDMGTHVPYHEGVRIALKYILSHKECQVEDPEFDAWCDRVIAALDNAKAALNGQKGEEK